MVSEGWLHILALALLLPPSFSITASSPCWILWSMSAAVLTSALAIASYGLLHEYHRDGKACLMACFSVTGLCQLAMSSVVFGFTIHDTVTNSPGILPYTWVYQKLYCKLIMEAVSLIAGVWLLLLQKKLGACEDPERMKELIVAASSQASGVAFLLPALFDVVCQSSAILAISPIESTVFLSAIQWLTQMAIMLLTLWLRLGLAFIPQTLSRYVICQQTEVRMGELKVLMRVWFRTYVMASITQVALSAVLDIGSKSITYRQAMYMVNTTQAAFIYGVISESVRLCVLFYILPGRVFKLHLYTVWGSSLEISDTVEPTRNWNGIITVEDFRMEELRFASFIKENDAKARFLEGLWGFIEAARALLMYLAFRLVISIYGPGGRSNWLLDVLNPEGDDAFASSAVFPILRAISALLPFVVNGLTKPLKEKFKLAERVTLHRSYSSKLRQIANPGANCNALDMSYKYSIPFWPFGNLQLGQPGSCLSWTSVNFPAHGRRNDVVSLSNSSREALIKADRLVVQAKELDVLFEKAMSF